MHGRYQSRLVIFVALLVVAGLGYVGVQFVRGFLPPGETTDINEYNTTLKQWTDTGLVGHFPASIPSEAQQVHFSAYPGYLQGGAHIQLRMQLPAQDIQRIGIQFKQSAPVAFAGGDIFSHINNDSENAVATTDFRTSGDPMTSVFPDHYTLYVLSSTDRGGTWNHGQTSGAAVSTVANEVVYWADSW